MSEIIRFIEAVKRVFPVSLASFITRTKKSEAGHRERRVPSEVISGSGGLRNQPLRSSAANHCGPIELNKYNSEESSRTNLRIFCAAASLGSAAMILSISSSLLKNL